MWRFMLTGRTEDRNQSAIKQKLTIPHAADDVCRVKYRPFNRKFIETQVSLLKYILNSQNNQSSYRSFQICAGGDKGKSYFDHLSGSVDNSFVKIFSQAKTLGNLFDFDFNFP